MTEAALLLRVAAERIIRAGRLNAKTAAHATLAQQLALAAEEAPYLLPTEELVGEDEDDRKWALWLGANLARRFRALATGQLEEGAKPREAVAVAAKGLDGRLRVIATTETARAYNVEREAELSNYFERSRLQVAADEGRLAAELDQTPAPQRRPFPAVAGTLVPFKWWNAAGDKRTCGRCDQLDGTVLPLNIPWPDGPPGSIHPNCRCTDDIILMPAWTEWDAAA